MGKVLKWLALCGALLVSPAMGQTAQVTQCVTSAIAGGTGNALTVPLLPCGLATNVLILTLSAANTAAVPTLQMVGFAPLPIVNADGKALTAGALPGAGAVVMLSGTGQSWILLTNGALVASAGGLSVTLNTTNAAFAPIAQSQLVIQSLTVPGASTVSLPAGTNWPFCPTSTLACPVIGVKDGKGNAGLYPITISAADGKLIDGQASEVIRTDWQELDFVYNGTGWVLK